MESVNEVPLIKSLGTAWLEAVAEHTIASGDLNKAQCRKDNAAISVENVKKRLMALVAPNNAAIRTIVVDQHIVVISRTEGITVCVLE